MLKIKRHYDRLKEKELVIENIYMREGTNEKLIIASDGLRNDPVYNSYLVEKRYFIKMIVFSLIMILIITLIIYLKLYLKTKT